MAFKFFWKFYFLFNVWQWCGDDYPFIHYRIMRWGSYNDYLPYWATWRLI